MLCEVQLCQLCEWSLFCCSSAESPPDLSSLHPDVHGFAPTDFDRDAAAKFTVTMAEFARFRRWEQFQRGMAAAAVSAAAAVAAGAAASSRYGGTNEEREVIEEAVSRGRIGDQNGRTQG